MNKRNKLERGGAHLVSIGMPAVCWKTHTPNITNMLSIKNSSILLMLVSDNILLRAFFFLQNKIFPFLKRDISCVKGRVVICFNAVGCFCPCLYVLWQIFRTFQNTHLIHTILGIARVSQHLWRNIWRYQRCDRKKKDRQYNGLKIRNKQWYTKHHRKLKIEQHGLH